MKKAGKNLIIINGNNKVSLSEGKSFLSVTIAFLAIAIIILAISHCCPEYVTAIVRWLIGIILSS